jgi:hypothetical protein
MPVCSPPSEVYDKGTYSSHRLPAVASEGKPIADQVTRSTKTQHASAVAGRRSRTLLRNHR